METFHTLAEVAVGFAGFASIAVLFRRGDRNEWSPVDALRYRAMLLGSLFACAFSLLPPLLVSFQIPSSILWASCSGLLLVYAAWRLTAYSVTRRIARSGTWIPLALTIFLALLQAANIVGFPLGRGPALYLAGICLLVFNVGRNFFQLVSVPAPSAE